MPGNLKAMLENNPDFRKLSVPYYFKAGATVRAFDESKPSFEDCEPIKRPALVVGEKIATTGACGEIRVAEVIHVYEDADGKHGVAFDGAMYMGLSFDKDDDHEWTMRGMWTKQFADSIQNR